MDACVGNAFLDRDRSGERRFEKPVPITAAHDRKGIDCPCPSSPHSIARKASRYVARRSGRPGRLGFSALQCCTKSRARSTLPRVADAIGVFATRSFSIYEGRTRSNSLLDRQASRSA